ncbi:DUF974-domain-containing protein, partial [Fistulina hepatica ATCC 64428]
LQGRIPLPTHPRTLRDLSQASELLTLPATFGSIQLGETFSSCLCVNNETLFNIEGVTLRVEMQTVSTKVLIGEFGGPESSLAAGNSLEAVVSHEIKELGQHVLACTVSYNIPPDVKPFQRLDDSNHSDVQGFRKFYKFAVANPLSVKTKVHTSKSPAALTSLEEREKIFLEVHIQNVTQDAMWFDCMLFEPVEGWVVQDANVKGDESLFDGANALMQPQDVRQYIYILTPTNVPLAPINYTPGSIIPLGRLDIAWRSSMGEPGRLLTSMLSRRIPLPASQQPPVSALPPHLKRSAVTSGPLRSHSPHPSYQSRPSSPAPRPASPMRNRPASMPGAGPTSHTPPPLPPPPPEFEVSLVIRDIIRPSTAIEKPFVVECTLVISSLPSLRPRRLLLIVQHVQSQPGRRRASPMDDATATLANLASPSLTVRSLGSDSFKPATAPASPTPTLAQIVGSSTQSATPVDPVNCEVMLPSPYVMSDPERGPSGVMYYGSSMIFLPTPAVPVLNETRPLSQGQVDFGLSYIALRDGLLRIGGLRVLLFADSANEEAGKQEIRILKEWDVITEIWT